MVVARLRIPQQTTRVLRRGGCAVAGAQEEFILLVRTLEVFAFPSPLAGEGPGVRGPGLAYPGYWNNEISKEWEAVAGAIWKAAQNDPSPPAPLPQGALPKNGDRPLTRCGWSAGLPFR